MNPRPACFSSATCPRWRRSDRKAHVPIGAAVPQGPCRTPPRRAGAMIADTVTTRHRRSALVFGAGLPPRPAIALPRAIGPATGRDPHQWAGCQDSTFTRAEDPQVELGPARFGSLPHEPQAQSCLGLHEISRNRPKFRIRATSAHWPAVAQLCRCPACRPAATRRPDRSVNGGGISHQPFGDHLVHVLTPFRAGTPGALMSSGRKKGQPEAAGHGPLGC